MSLEFCGKRRITKRMFRAPGGVLRLFGRRPGTRMLFSWRHNASVSLSNRIIIISVFSAEADARTSPPPDTRNAECRKCSFTHTGFASVRCTQRQREQLCTVGYMWSRRLISNYATQPKFADSVTVDRRTTSLSPRVKMSIPRVQWEVSPHIHYSPAIGWLAPTFPFLLAPSPPFYAAKAIWRGRRELPSQKRTNKRKSNHAVLRRHHHRHHHHHKRVAITFLLKPLVPFIFDQLNHWSICSRPYAILPDTVTHWTNYCSVLNPC